MQRSDGRGPLDLRPITLHPGFQVHAEGSVLIDLGLTRVLCAVSLERKAPPFLRGSGAGWVTAEYGMLPRSTHTRTQRETARTSGRTHEIQRLIGRSLRAVTNLDLLGERAFTVDCDVLQADGGTRTAAVTGGYVALYLALHRLVQGGLFSAVPLTAPVAATSVGLVDGTVLLDLTYEEDARAEVDFNVVKSGSGGFVEIQGTAEGQPFSRAIMDEMIAAAEQGLAQLFRLQQESIERATAG